MWKKLIEQSRVTFKDRVESWEEAIREAARPLVVDRAVEESYVEAMIKCVHEYGPYIVIAPDIAIPHARGEFGVNETAISFMRVKKPVRFGEAPEYHARLIFVIASTGNDSHVPLLQSVVAYLTEENVAKLLEAESPEDLQSLAVNV